MEFERGSGLLSPTVSGGERNTASNSATVAGGQGNTASGQYATVPGGTRAFATNNGAFVWSGTDWVRTESTNNNSFTVRAPGGARFLSTTNTDNFIGVILTNAATAWSSLSDSNAKTAVKAVSPRAVLAKLEGMPVTEWEYKHDPDRRYFGPMAQDFHAAFGLGRDDKTINTLDADGVLFLSVKGLVEELKARDKAIEELQAQNEQLSRKIEAVEQRLNALPPAP